MQAVRTRTFAIVAVLTAVLVLGAGGTYAYDATRSDLIARGVTVDGVDVGGMRAPQARVALRRALLDPLQEPVVARHDGRQFELTAREAGVGVDIDGSVDRALDASRDGNFVVRAWRGLTGAEVAADVEARTTYDKQAIASLVDRVRKAVDKPAVDATVNLDAGVVDPKPSEDGLKVRAARLRREVTAGLLSRDGDRSVRVRTAVVQPKVSTDDLADKYPAVMIVDRASFTLRLYKRLKLSKTYSIAVGQVGMETPAGLYHVQNKAVDPSWHVPQSEWAGDLAGKVIPPGPENPIKARWMGIFDGAGIHGTDAAHSIGTAASHGCIRMRIPEVIELYDQVPVNAPVYIA
jgi:lipoprotein-anchoring transpeptidase ErfK/SrfK